MTPDAQRIAIAEACGYTYHGEATYGGSQKNGWWLGDKYCFHGIPDYLSDLNAMHEAEKALNAEQWMQYLDRLGIITDGRLRSYTHATAAQRAEAFLRTLNLWDDSK